MHPTRSPITTLVDFIIGPVTTVSQRTLVLGYLNFILPNLSHKMIVTKTENPSPIIKESINTTGSSISIFWWLTNKLCRTPW